MNFTLVAKETVPNNAKYSSVPVTVYIRDMNDNFPEFTEPFYEVIVCDVIQKSIQLAFAKQFF